MSWVSPDAYKFKARLSWAESSTACCPDVEAFVIPSVIQVLPAKMISIAGIERNFLRTQFDFRATKTGCVSQVHAVAEFTP